MNFFSKRRAAKRAGRRSHHRFVPGRSFAQLEARQLLAAGPLGVNLDGSLGFVDVMKENSGWTSLTSSTLNYDSNGWPLSDASVLVFDQRVNQPWNGPDNNAVQPDIGGTYHLSFTGKATVSPDWLQNYTVQNQVYNAATNTTTADLVVTHNSLAMLYIDFRNTVNPSSSSGAGVSNVKLIQPGYAADTTQMFTTNMLNALSPFGTIRYLNADSANSYAPTYDSSGKLIPLNWSQRRLPGSNVGAPGAAWEYMVALANATNTDMWINVPGPATDDYVKQLANLIKNGDTVNGVTYAGLKPGLKVYLEYSNEVWGGIGNTTAYNNAASQQEANAGGSVLTADGTTNSYSWAQRYYLERSMQIVNDFRSVYGADPNYSTIRPVLGWQEGDVGYYVNNLAWFEQTFGAPNQYFYGMGNANYTNPSDYSSVDNLIASLYASIPNEAITTAQFSTVATYYGLKNVAYEGGVQTTGASNDQQGQVALAAARDPRMEDLETKFYQTWYAAGGGLAMVFDGPFGFYGPYYQWALAEASQASNPSASAKYRGMVDLSQAAPTPVTAGTVVSSTGVTSLPINGDSLTHAFTSPGAGQTNTWLINVPAAGNYTLSIQTSAGSAAGQVVVSTSDTNTVGTYTLGKAAGTYNLTSLALHAGLNTIAIKTLVGMGVVGLSLSPASGSTASGSTVADPGFEAVGLAAGGYVYNPSGTPWTFGGQSGVAAKSSPFTGSMTVPQGSEVGFVQNAGSISQVVNVATPGYYQLGFSMAQRPGYATQTFQVVVDGSVVATYSTTTGGFQSASTPTFMLNGGQHTITFQGVGGNGDVTALLDNVALAPATAAAVVADPSFESLGLAAGYGNYRYNPGGTAWTYSGQAGVSGNNTAFTSGNPAAPQGVDVAFLQNQGSMSQVVSNWAAGSYSISFLAAQRANYGTSRQSIQVLIDGTSVGTFTPSGTSYQALTTASFTVAAGSHTITFKGTNSGGDYTAFIDGVALNQAAPPAPASTVAAGDSSFEGANLAAGTYQYNPSGTAWTYYGSSGTTANGSAFTSGNPSAPAGTQVAFLQNGGIIAQTVSNWAAGAYTISFSAAQRGNQGGSQGINNQSIQVYVDGVSVGTITPTGTGYQTYTTPSFTVAAGSHLIAFRGTNTNGDNTAFLDGITITSAGSNSGSGSGSGSGSTGGTSSAAATLGDSGFEAANMNGKYAYNPGGSNWTFSPWSGLSANYTAFTTGNPAAPQGSQVAFVQNQGTISQTFTSTGTGNFAVSLQAAQRGNYGSSQSFQVLIDGVVLSTFANLPTTYTTLTTASFVLAAGSHTITIQGLNASGDATAFIDNVTLVAQ